MDIYLILVVSLASIFSSVHCNHIPVTLDIKDPEKTCCPLEWSDVRTLSRENLPQQAVTVNATDGAYYLMKTSETLGFLRVPDLDRTLIAESSALLTNPHQCKIIWVDQDSSSDSIENNYTLAHTYIPLFNGMILSRSFATVIRFNRYGNREHSDERNFGELSSLVGMRTIKSRDDCSDSSYYCKLTKKSILQIDCQSSVKNILSAHLEKIIVNDKLVNNNSVSIEFTPHKIINNGNWTYETSYNAEINLPISLDIDLELKNLPFLDYLAEKNSMNGFMLENEKNPLINFFKMPQIKSQLEYLHRAARTRTIEGSGSQPVSQVKINRQVSVASGQTCKFTGSVDAFKGTGPVEIIFSIRPRSKSKYYWTNKKILSSLKASDCDVSQLNEQNGLLTFNLTGVIDAVGFYNERITTECEPVNIK